LRVRRRGAGALSERAPLTGAGRNRRRCTSQKREEVLGVSAETRAYSGSFARRRADRSNNSIRDRLSSPRSCSRPVSSATTAFARGRARRKALRRSRAALLRLPRSWRDSVRWSWMATPSRSTENERNLRLRPPARRRLTRIRLRNLLSSSIVP
jgi:hypothetical protein